MKRLFGKEFNFKKIWKNLDTNQRFSLSILLFLLVSFPVSLLLSLTPVKLFSRAQLPATPPITITSTPTVSNGPRCGSSTIPPATGPAPLTVILHGGGSMGAFGLVGYQWDFENDGIWDTSFQYISLDPVVHIYTQPGIYQPKFRVLDEGSNWSPACDYLYDVVVLEPTGTLTPTETHGPTPTFTATPTPSIASAIPSFTTRYLKPGMSGRRYKTFIRGEDLDRDKLTIESSGLPQGVSLRECKMTYSKNLSRITCEISGVPGMSGIYRPAFELRDDTGAGVTGSYTLFILPKLLP